MATLPLSEFVKSEEFTKMVIDSMMQNATILPSGIATMGQSDMHRNYWSRGTYVNEPELEERYRDNFRRAYFGEFAMGLCHPSRQPFTGYTIRNVHTYHFNDASYHPENEPIQVEGDNVFAPRPAYVPVDEVAI